MTHVRWTASEVALWWLCSSRMPGLLERSVCAAFSPDICWKLLCLLLGVFSPVLGCKASNMVVGLVNRRMPGEGFSFYSCPGLSNLRFPVQPSASWQCFPTALNTLKYFSPWASHFTSQLQENENRLPSWLGEIISSSCLHRNQVTMAKKVSVFVEKPDLKRQRDKIYVIAEF